VLGALCVGVGIRARLTAAFDFQHVDFEKKKFRAGWRTLCRRLCGELHDWQKNLAALPRDKVDHRNPRDIRDRGSDRVLDRAGIPLAGGMPAHLGDECAISRQRIPG
jgi:hypothetical protein